MTTKLNDFASFENGLIHKFANRIFSPNGPSLSQMWLLQINKEDMEAIYTLVRQNLPWYEPNLTVGNINKYIEWLEKDMYNLLAYSVSMPGDAINVARNTNGLESSGAIGGLTGSARGQFANVRVQFMETNNSIIDGFFRPWVAMIGHLSLKEFNYRIPITIIQYAKSGLMADGKLIPRKILRLKNAAPVNVDAEELNYTADKIIFRNIEFVYSKYELENLDPVLIQKDITLEDIKYEGDPALEVNKKKEMPLVLQHAFYTEKDTNTIDEIKPSNVTYLEPWNQIDTINKPEITINLFNPQKSWLEIIQGAVNDVRNGIATAEGIVNQATSKISEMQSQASQLALKLGMENEAVAINKSMENLKASTTVRLSDALSNINTKVDAGTNLVNLVGEVSHAENYKTTSQISSKSGPYSKSAETVANEARIKGAQYF